MMARNNIRGRRAAVAALLEASDPVAPITRKQLAQTFGCSPSAILADIIALQQADRAPIHVTPAMRRFVSERDRVCQYCGETRDNMVAEHIVPAALGGPAQPHNLVLACQSCNTRKRRSVWKPMNLDNITYDFPDWKARILELATGP